jgi:hypothetical protein
MKVNSLFKLSLFVYFFKTDEPVMLKRPQIVDTIPTNIRSNIPTSPKKDFVNLENKLQRLEQLQYALTKQVNYFLLTFKINNFSFSRN